MHCKLVANKMDVSNCVCVLLGIVRHVPRVHVKEEKESEQKEKKLMPVIMNNMP